MTTSTKTTQTTSPTDLNQSLRIYNTLTRKKEPFETVVPGKVGIYLCGPTVYDKAHIGHMVGPVIFDCIKRYLEYCGFSVTWVVNITDVDDKLIRKAQERKISMLEVAEENIRDYHDNLAALGVDKIDHFPRATACMDDIVQFVQALIDQGFAYHVDGDVYFDVQQSREYGKLSNRNIESIQGDGGGAAAKKRHIADFALWKSAKPGEPHWDSPWGHGRPGWHIECSAMSHKLLGQTFDIHGGGLDLKFPHHENELAQSECCHRAPMVRYWAHNGLLRATTKAGKIGGRGEREADEPAADEVQGKMSRSQGAGGLADLAARQSGERIRFFLLRTHYRSTVLFNEEELEEAGAGLDGFYRLFKRYQRITGDDAYALDFPTQRLAADAHPLAGDVDALRTASNCREKFLAAMDDDFNTGGAIAELFELAKLANRLCDEGDLEGSGKDSANDVAVFVAIIRTIKELAALLGLFLSPPAATSGQDDAVDGVLQLVVDLRAEARTQKDFATADTIRDALAANQISLEDRAGGTEWEVSCDNPLDALLPLVIDLRAQARHNKDFATADTIRDRLQEIGILLEDRAGGTDWQLG